MGHTFTVAQTTLVFASFSCLCTTFLFCWTVWFQSPIFKNSMQPLLAKIQYNEPP